MIPLDDLPSVPLPGQVVAGKYRVEGEIGAGGMGVVLAAHHVVLNQRVAIKFLHPHAISEPIAVERFLREARTAASIQSEHIARVLDVGTLEETGLPYLVMEHLTGTDLSQLLKARKTFPITDAVDFILQAAEAIAEAHKLGIIHRDLKPGNLFLTLRPDGSPLVKVLDFGLSKVTVMADQKAYEKSLTQTGTFLGSSHYMSPEQIRNLKSVDARTDIWALGVILYQFITGNRPFDGTTFPAICASVIADTPPAMQDVPSALEKVILRCLEKDLNQRFKSLAEVAEQLRPFGSPHAATSVNRIINTLSDNNTYRSSIASLSGATNASIVTESIDLNSATGQMNSWGNTKHVLKRKNTAIMIAGSALIIAVVGLAAYFALWIQASPVDGQASSPLSTLSSLPEGTATGAVQAVEPVDTTVSAPPAVESSVAADTATAQPTVPVSAALTSKVAATTSTVKPVSSPARPTSSPSQASAAPSVSAASAPKPTASTKPTFTPAFEVPDD